MLGHRMRHEDEGYKICCNLRASQHSSACLGDQIRSVEVREMSKMMHAIRLEKTVLALVRIRPIVPGDEWPIRPAERRRFKRGHRELLMNFSAAHVYSERAVTVPSHRLSRLCYVLTFTRAFCVPP